MIKTFVYCNFCLVANYQDISKFNKMPQLPKHTKFKTFSWLSCIKYGIVLLPTIPCIIPNFDRYICILNNKVTQSHLLTYESSSIKQKN